MRIPMLDYYTLALAAVVVIVAAVVRIVAAIAVGVATAAGVVAVGLYSSSKIVRYRGIGELDLIAGTARIGTDCFRAGVARDGLTKMGHARTLTAKIIVRSVRTRIVV